MGGRIYLIVVEFPFAIVSLVLSPAIFVVVVVTTALVETVVIVTAAKTIASSEDFGTITRQQFTMMIQGR